ncbi:MAG: hypothetical protein ACK4GL_01730 [Flavobacteriales bacterium]
MKKLIIFMLVSPGFLMAQRGMERERKLEDKAMRERIKAERIAYITEQVSLSAEEAQLFWPVYNNFTNELEQIRKDLRKTRKNRNQNLDKLSDKELDDSFADELKLMERQSTLMRDNHQQIRKVLPARKVAQLYEAEQKFRMQLMKRMRERGLPPPEEE